MPQPCGMNSWFSRKVLCKTAYAGQKGSAVVCRYRHYQTLSICLTLIFYAPSLPAGRTPCAVRWAPNWVLCLIHHQIWIIRWYMMPESRDNALTKPQDVFPSWCSVVTQRCFKSAAKPLVWCMYAVACFPSLLFLPLRMSAHQLLRNEHRAYKLDGGNYLQNQIWMLQPKQTYSKK